MFIIRNANTHDINDLYSLSQNANLLNLPSDKDKISELIDNSLRSFQTPNSKREDNYYLFCIVDQTKNKTIGVSMIHGKHGTTQKPHYFLKVGKEVKKSNSLKTEIINHTLKLGIEPNGYTEIGGLVLDQNYRRSEQKLGKQLSMSRFLYIVQHPHLFTKEIHSELLPPFDKDGKSLLWEGLGRKFLNMDYWEADLLSQQDRTFIHDLFPSSTIYQNLLPLPSVEVIGKVGENTKPVKRMLESIGFKYTNEVDPFDGGPHYRAELIDLLPYKNFLNISGAELKSLIMKNKNKIFLSDMTKNGEENDCLFSAKTFRDTDVNEIIDEQQYDGFFI